MNRKILWISVLLALTLALTTALTGCGASPEDDPNLSDDDWALGKWGAALEKMQSEGAFDNGDNSFKGEGFYYNNGRICFKDEAAEKKYTEEPFEISGKIIWGMLDYDQDDNCSISVFTNTAEGSDKPAYYAGNSVNTTLPPDAFADKRSECNYLVVYGGLTTSIDEDYYGKSWDRENVSTYVFVIDTANEEMAHIQFIDSDHPGMITDHRIGKTYDDQAREYMTGIYK